jgi:L-lactate dehydrogenase complex protein LldF
VLANLDLYLEAYEERVRAAGGHVHWARTAEEAREIILGICRGRRPHRHQGQVDDREEIALNDALEAQGHRAGSRPTSASTSSSSREPPSHIIAPAVHLTKEQVETGFRRVHTHLRPRTAT